MLPDLSTTDLQTYRDSLLLRLGRGMEALRAKEEAHDTGPQYQGWVEVWERLLKEYEAASDKLADLGAPACAQVPCVGTCDECQAISIVPSVCPPCLLAASCADCKAESVDPPPSPDALGVAWRVGLGAPYFFTTEGQVSGLALQLQRFAGAVPILALPTYAGSEDENGQGDYAN